MESSAYKETALKEDAAVCATSSSGSAATMPASTQTAGTVNNTSAENGAGSCFALEAKNLTLSWDGQHIVAKEVSLAVHPGEVVCLVGRSGCGKTTILHALAGLSMPLSGQVLLEGEDITGKPGHVAYMLQKDLLLPNRRIIDNVCLPAVIAGTGKAQARAKAQPLFERFGLAGTQNLWPAQLSGGMRQRAAFLRTYLMGARTTLLDEPFSALDALTRTDMRSWFLKMVKELGLSALVITHDVEEALALATHTYVLAGSPAQGVPSHIAGCVTLMRNAALSQEQFELSDDFLNAKRQVMQLLK